MQPGRAVHLSPELAAHPQYEILRELGQGGMGVVYLAKNKLMDRLEVLKVVNKSLLDHPGAVERFLREIRSAAKLNHPNIVTAYSALQSGELLAFAMEYVEGEDLSQVVKARGPLPVAHACHYVQQAALGLQHAFEKAMVHRDIKPQNLILAREHKKHIVKVLDFGLAKATREKADDTGLTGAGQMLGTPDFIAPEQSVDAASADIRADIYSLGCTLYSLLTGAPPFRGKSLGAILLAHQSTEALPLNLARADVPEAVAAVVRKMMAKEPSQRYQTPAEVVQALSAAVKSAATGGEAKSSTHIPASPTKTRRDAEKRLLGAETIVPSTGSAQATMMGVMAASTVARDAPSTSNRGPAAARQGWGGRKRRAPAGKKWLIGGGIGVAVLVLALLGIWASGVFKVNTKNGILLVEVNEPNPDVYVDGEKVTATWDGGGQKAEIRVRPGTHKVEVIKDGFSVWGEEVELQHGKRRVLTARLVSKLPPPTAKSDLPLQAKEAAMAFEKARDDARANLLAEFDTVLDGLASSNGSTEARLNMINVVKEEKRRFENSGLIPWSKPMRAYLATHFASTRAAEDKLRQVYNSLIDTHLRAKNVSMAADLRADLVNLLAVRVVARWNYFLNGRLKWKNFSLSSNGTVFGIDGRITWTYVNGELIIRYPPDPRAPGGAFIDVLHVKDDGTAFVGTNNVPRGRGPKITGIYLKPD